MDVRCSTVLLSTVITLSSLGVAPVSGQEAESTRTGSLVASLQSGQSLSSAGDVGVDWEGYGTRLEVLPLMPFAPFAQIEYASRGISCPDAVGINCPGEGWAATAGGNIRLTSIGPGFLRPYLGAGMGIFRWSDGNTDAIAQGHVGADWMLGNAGLRTETGLNESGWFLGFGLAFQW